MLVISHLFMAEAAVFTNPWYPRGDVIVQRFGSPGQRGAEGARLWHQLILQF